MRERNREAVVKKRPSPHLTRSQRELIQEMFLGPYKPEWKDDRGIVDNRDSTIAKRVGVETGVVSACTEKISAKHFDKIIKLINETK